MNSTSLTRTNRIQWCWPALLALGVAASTLAAAETNASNAAVTNAPVAVATNAPPTAATNTPPAAATNAPQKHAEAPALTPEQMFEGGAKSYNNWIELSTGGFINNGNKAQFQQQAQARGGAFGGVQDFHFTDDLTKGTTLTLDGRALVDENDYRTRVDLTREKLGYVRFSFDQDRTWSSGDGGFFPPTGSYFPLQEDALALDRGEISFEAGLRLDKFPKVTFKYTRTYREGEKGSTIWGPTEPTGNPAVTRALAPSFYDINEHSDIFQLDATHQIKATELGVGVRYETGKLDDALKINEFPGQPIQQKITDRQGTDYDLFNAHSFTETWIKKNLMLSSGFAYSDLDNDFSGSRIYGSDFDVGFVPALGNGAGYFNLNGGSHLHEYVGDLNLFYKPMPNLSIVPSVRVQKEDTDANANGLETLGINTPQTFAGTSDLSDLNVRERLDVTYNGLTNWVFYARGELTEGNGDLSQNGGVVGTGILPIDYHSDQDRFFQKYSAGARWYPVRRVTLDAGGYYKRDEFNYENRRSPIDPLNPALYPGFLTMQNFDTYDGNFRMTLRPRQNVTTISRYEFQYSTIHTEPDSGSGLGETMSSKMTSHILAQDVSWTPWSRLYLQASFNYVLSTTETPASDFTQSVLEAQNNYWTVNFNPTLVVDNKTDLKLGFFYYRANDYSDNSSASVPYGSGAEEYGLTAMIIRRISEHLRLSLRYGFTHYTDALYGGNRDFDAHLVYSSLQYRF